MAAGRASMAVRRHHFDARIVAACLAVAAILAAAMAPAVAARDNSWTLTRTPPTIPVNQATTIVFLATNTSAGGGGGEIGCIVIVVPSDLSVGAVSVTSDPSGSSWTDTQAPGAGGSTVIRLRAANADSVLAGDPQDDRLGFTVRVTGSPPGVTTWTADVFNKIDCDNDMGLTLNVQVTISANPQTPAPTPAPTPTPTAAPTPTAVPTPTPAPTPTPVVTAKPTVPPPSATGSPAATPTAMPTARPTAAASAAPGTTALPSPSSTPTANETPVASLPVITSSSPSPGVDASPSVEPTSAPTSDPAGQPVAGVGGGDPPPGAAFTFQHGSGASATESGMFSDSFAQFTTMFGRAFDWAIPGLVLSIPGMLLVLAIAAQAVGALAWLPLVRRRIGGFGLRDAPATPRR